MCSYFACVCVLRALLRFSEEKKRGKKKKKIPSCKKIIFLLFSSLYYIYTRERSLALRQIYPLFSLHALLSLHIYTHTERERERERERKKEGNKAKNEYYYEKERGENLLGKTNFSAVRSPLVERAAARPARHDE